MLKEHDGVIVVDGGEHETQRILRCRGIDHLQAGDVGHPRFQRLGVLRCCAHARAAWQTHHHRQRYLAAEHIAHFGGLVYQLIHADGQKVTEHQLGDGAEPRGRGADGGADDGPLADRSIAHTFFAELIKHSGGYAEASSESAHVLAEQQHVGILTHPDAHGFTDGFCITHFFHLARTSSTMSE